MSIVKRLGTVAVAAGLAIALMAPTGAQARNGRIAAGGVVGEAVGGVFWGPSPPYYPYYLSLLSFRLLRGSGLGARPVLGTLRVRLLSSGRFDRSSWAPRARL
jgi:hypothetical protein